MKMQHWAEWLHYLNAVAPGATVTLTPRPGGGMEIAAQWANRNTGGKSVYSYCMGRGELRRMYLAGDKLVFDQITNAVRRMVEDQK